MTATILTIALFTFGIHGITRDGMIFGFVERFWEYKNNPFYSKAISECPPCMTSLWGLLLYPIIGGNFILYAVAIIAASGLNYIIATKL